ncbi:MAG: LysM peptidoglycan-binding domain-containing protein [Anaerolineae bacterium]
MRGGIVALILALGLTTVALPVMGAPGERTGPTIYIVQWGDTLFSIANRFGTTVEALMAANGLTSPLIYVGQRLTIPSSTSIVTQERSTGYLVQYGDTLYSIARRFGVSVEALMRANSLYSHFIYVGQGLTIPGGDSPTISEGYVRSSAPSVASEASTLEYGVGLSAWGEKSYEQARLAREAGFIWVRQGFPWREMEVGKGIFDWGVADRVVEALEGFSIIALVDSPPSWAQTEGPANSPPDNYRDLGDFLYALASRYGGRIKAYQIWREPNLASQWGRPNAAEYVALSRVAYLQIKAADPEALVISAGLAPTESGLPVAVPDDLFLRQIYQAGGRRYFDLLGVNAPGFRAPPEVSPEEVAESPLWGGRRAFSFRRVEDLRRIMVENGDEAKKVAITEFGWSTDKHRWHAVTEEEQADYLVRAYRWARENWSGWARMMVAPPLADPGWTESNEGYFWAITFPDGSLHPAYEALKAMQK